MTNSEAQFNPKVHAAENGGFTQADFGYILLRLTQELQINWGQGCVFWHGKDGSAYLAWPLPEPDRFDTFHEWNIFRTGPVFPDGSLSADFFEVRYDRAEDLVSMNHTGHEVTEEMINLREVGERVRADIELQERLGMNRPTEQDGDLLAEAFEALFDAQRD